MKKAKAKKAATGATKKDGQEQEAAPEAPGVADAPPAADADVAVEEPRDADESADTTPPITTAAPSLAQQSKLRSSSFRKTSVSGPISPLFQGPLSPDGETAPDIYTKHVARIEELEKENKRLAREAAEAEKRWQKVEEELADLREADGDAPERSGGGGDQVAKLVRFALPTLVAVPDAPYVTSADRAPRLLF